MTPDPAAATSGPHTLLAPSPWVMRFVPLIEPGARVLDLACGGGRHVRALAARGFAMHAVDRDAQAVEPLRAMAQVTLADLEAGAWPLGENRFGAVIVTNYLWRPLLPHIVQAVAEGGVLIYETFALGNGSVGKPSNSDFLLRPGELLDAARPHLRVVAYEDGFVAAPKPAFVQRICAVREHPPAPAVGAGSHPAKYNL
ncbi:MAG: methyltransferase domain-containing protein [Betaproteobacteria bacterium]|nr:methyltransferase domain-containing protein [Betaproteobacteria bacterium]OZB63385.1 MAG: SAM-dependent methyltransferase [Thiomonas sp. 13-66-29]